MNLADNLNQYVYQIKNSPIRQFDQDVSSIEGIIKLTLGEPDFATPDHVSQAAIQAIEDGFTNYTATPGYRPLLEACSQFMQERYGLTYSPKEVMVTSGATEALSVAFKSIINPGDKILIASPFFTLYQSMVTLYGGEPILIDTSSNGFVLSPAMVEEKLDEHGDSIKAIVINYPTNPTGMIWSRQDARALAELLADKPIFVISDEVYSEINYEGDHVSIAEFLPEQTLVVNGVSKSHSMTGWRIGFLYARQELMQHFMKVHQNFITTASSVSQAAALEAIKNGPNDAEAMVEEYRQRRDYIYDKMTALGFGIIKPNGAFYIFAEIPEDLEQDSLAFCYDLARTSRLAFVPGSAFGIGGENYVRLSYAASMDEIVEAMKRLEEYVNLKRR